MITPVIFGIQIIDSMLIIATGTRNIINGFRLPNLSERLENNSAPGIEIQATSEEINPVSLPAIPRSFCK
ncbi:hypothetical protein SDC9_193696 [bioreactor metagenome]|uniref:Uncharacterized protein n=1 Tax=bioreactor metagenome TaxID=1076179 RepID=A0A645IFG5_9ZZZZ